MFFSDVQSVNKEVGSGTDATISCIISGISQQLNAVIWTKDGTDVTTVSGSNYIVSSGTYDSNSQTTTLTVKAAANTADSTYTCVITSIEYEETNKETPVALNVFGKIFYQPVCKSFSRFDTLIADLNHPFSCFRVFQSALSDHSVFGKRKFR